MEELILEVCNKSFDWCWPNWPLTIFLKDNEEYPPDDNFIECLINSTDDYLLFFRESRGFDRPLGFYVELWNDIRGNIILLHMEKEVSRILLLEEDERIPEDEQIVVLIQTLAYEERDNWMNILNKLSMEQDV